MSKFVDNNDSLVDDKDILNDLFIKSDGPITDDSGEFMAPQLVIDINKLDEESSQIAAAITGKLADYYFRQEYLDNHPYISNKIMMVTSSVRRLQKMLQVNEAAQDALLQSIMGNSAKGSLYSSLTSIQQSTLNIQKQQDELIKELEEIFRKMQDECKIEESDKQISEDGSMTIRGAKDFIKQITTQISGERTQMVNTQTGEVLSTSSNFTVTEK